MGRGAGASAPDTAAGRGRRRRGRTRGRRGTQGAREADAWWRRWWGGFVARAAAGEAPAAVGAIQAARAQSELRAAATIVTIAVVGVDARVEARRVRAGRGGRRRRGRGGRWVESREIAVGTRTAVGAVGAPRADGVLEAGAAVVAVAVVGVDAGVDARARAGRAGGRRSRGWWRTQYAARRPRGRRRPWGERGAGSILARAAKARAAVGAVGARRADQELGAVAAVVAVAVARVDARVQANARTGRARGRRRGPGRWGAWVG